MARKGDSANSRRSRFFCLLALAEISFFRVFKALRKFTKSKGRRKVNEVRRCIQAFCER